MLRRCLIAFAVMGLISVMGCGSMMLVQYGEPIWLLHRVDRIYAQPSHRVALATFEVLKAELKTVEVVDEEMTQDDQFDKPDRKTPAPGEIQIPDNVPAFWMEGLSPSPIIVNLRMCNLRGKDRDGREVEAWVRIRLESPKLETVVSIQVGGRGDNKASKALLDKIAERLAHPADKPGSAEERKTLQAFYLPESGKGTGKAKGLSSREFRIRKD